MCFFSYCYAGHDVLPTLFKNLIKPKKYYLVINYIFLWAILGYISITFIGYYAYGSFTDENIVDNFNKKSYLTKSIAIFIIISITTKFILASFPITEGWTEFLMGMMVPIYQDIDQIEQYNDIKQRLWLPISYVRVYLSLQCYYHLFSQVLSNYYH